MPKSSPRKPAENRPVHEVRHRQISAAIWKNQTEKGVMYSVTIKKSYKDQDGNWHDTQSFGFDDLLTVSKAMYDAHSLISAAQARDRAAAREARQNGS